jgi:hypothetical protein
MYIYAAYIYIYGCQCFLIIMFLYNYDLCLILYHLFSIFLGKYQLQFQSGA